MEHNKEQEFLSKIFLWSVLAFFLVLTLVMGIGIYRLKMSNQRFQLSSFTEHLGQRIESEYIERTKRLTQILSIRSEVISLLEKKQRNDRKIVNLVQLVGDFFAFHGLLILNRQGRAVAGGQGYFSDEKEISFAAKEVFKLASQGRSVVLPGKKENALADGLLYFGAPIFGQQTTPLGVIILTLKLTKMTSRLIIDDSILAIADQEGKIFASNHEQWVGLTIGSQDESPLNFENQKKKIDILIRGEDYTLMEKDYQVSFVPLKISGQSWNMYFLRQGYSMGPLKKAESSLLVQLTLLMLILVMSILKLIRVIYYQKMSEDQLKEMIQAVKASNVDLENKMRSAWNYDQTNEDA